MESEYDLQILLGDELKNQFETILKKSNSFKQEADGEMVTKILEIADSLKIEKNQVPKFLSEILSSKTDQLTHLKILHFDVSQEISRMEKLKKRINETGSRRATIILFILLAALIFQTALYYHLIFNVEHLGWDLMEPTTYLISSVLFLLGVMSYVKLQRNAISGERILQNFSQGFYLKRSVRDNFNNEKYQVLKRRKELITREIESFKH
jgi:hypothetical protein